jgi:hypothetical protein
MKKYLFLFVIIWFLLPNEVLGQTDEFSWVYLYYTNSFGGRRPTFTVFFNDKETLQLKKKARVKYKIYSTGDIKISCFYGIQNNVKLGESSVTLNIQHGKTYYVKLYNAYLKLVIVDEATGQQEFNKPFLAEIQNLVEDIHDPIIKKEYTNTTQIEKAPSDNSAKKLAKLNLIALSVMDLNVTSGLAPNEVIMLTEKLLNEFVTNGFYKIIERSKRDEILKEQGFQQSGACDQSSCLVEVGQLLGVQKMVGGTIGKIGSLYGVELRVMDVKTGEIDKAFSREYSGDVSALLGAMKDAAAVFSHF